MMKKILTKNYLYVRRWRNTLKGYYEELIPLGKRTFHFRHILLHCSFQVNLKNVIGSPDKIDGIGILSNPTCNSVNEMSISPLLLGIDEARVIIIIHHLCFIHVLHHKHTNLFSLHLSKLYIPSLEKSCNSRFKLI